jgi:hypothetical protein
MLPVDVGCIAPISLVRPWIFYHSFNRSISYAREKSCAQRAPSWHRFIVHNESIDGLVTSLGGLAGLFASKSPLPDEGEGARDKGSNELLAV